MSTNDFLRFLHGPWSAIEVEDVASLLLGYSRSFAQDQPRLMIIV